MKVSVIVPVYNVEKYLEKCLDSLVEQTLKDIEIIVVNDGTTDNSQEIIDKYEEKYPEKVKGYIKENGGLSSARNYGLKYAEGEYIFFVDSDDYLELETLEKMYRKAEEEKLDIIVCDSIEVYDTGKRIYKKSNLHYSNNDIKNYIIGPPMTCIRMYKKEILKNLKFEEGIFYEDLNLNPSLVKKTLRIGFIEEGLYNYYQRFGSIMRQNEFHERLLDIFKVLENNYNELIDNYSEEVEYLYITHLLRTTTLRFLDYSNTRTHLLEIRKIMKERFPNWKKNEYYKKSSFKLKVICLLAYYKLYYLLKFIKKVV